MNELTDVDAALSVARSASVREMLEKQRDKLKTQLAKLNEREEPKKRGRPPLDPQVVYDREMAKLEARQKAREDFKKRLDSRVLPTFRGRWWRREDQKVISVSEHGTYLDIERGRLVGGARRVAELSGEWEYMGPEPEVRAAPSATQLASEEHERLTKRYKKRCEELFGQLLKPCANYRCDAAIDYSDPRRFCEACENMLKDR